MHQVLQFMEEMKIFLSEKDNVDNPISLYGNKKSNELVFTYSHLFKISTTGLRFLRFMALWETRYGIIFICKSFNYRKFIDVFNHGNMIRDFIFIDDIIEGVVVIVKSC